jgi:hypothetical protein
MVILSRWHYLFYLLCVKPGIRAFSDFVGLTIILRPLPPNSPSQTASSDFPNVKMCNDHFKTVMKARLPLLSIYD